LDVVLSSPRFRDVVAYVKEERSVRRRAANDTSKVIDTGTRRWSPAAAQVQGRAVPRSRMRCRRRTEVVSVLRAD